MNTTSNLQMPESCGPKSRGGGIRLLAAMGVLVLGACIQGPWDYYPNNPAPFHGVFVTGYAIAGRPVANICFERMLDLAEERTDAFAFYDAADVRITGSFGGTVATLALRPLGGKPNCFEGDTNALVETGRTYALDARITWDSAGRKVDSRLTGTARVPTAFSIHDTASAPGFASTGAIPANPFTVEFFNSLPPHTKAVMTAEFGADVGKFLIDSAGVGVYLEANGPRILERLTGLLAQERFRYTRADTVFYLGGVLNTLSHYFSSDRSDDVNAVLVTQQFDPDSSRPVTRFDSPFGLPPDSSDYYFPGDIRRLVIYPDASNDKGWKVLDSIGVVNTWFHTGRNRLFFYAVEQAYIDFIQTTIEGDARVKPKYNIDGGQGVFAGAVPDTFDVRIRVDFATKAYSLPAAHAAFCRDRSGWFRNQDCREYYRPYCSGKSWLPGDCGQDAIQACFEADLNGNDTLKARCDSVSKVASEDTVVLAAAELRFCVAEDFPAQNGACAAQKVKCQETFGTNTCKQAMWEYCLDNGWPHGQCDLGLVSYCRDKPRLSETLCKHADEYCRAHPGETLCK